MLTATVPSSVAAGMYLVWVENNAGVSNPVCLNRADAEWLGLLSPTKAPGQSLRAFGKNLSKSHGTSNAYVYLQPSGGGSFTACTVGTIEPEAVTFTWTIIMVMNYTSYGTLFKFTGTASDSSAMEIAWNNYGDSNHWLLCGKTGSDDNSYALVAATGSAYVVTLTFDGTNTTIYNNGNQASGGSNRNKDSGVGGNFTAYQLLGGSIGVGEFLVYNRLLSNTELDSVHNALGSKYNLTIHQL